jgi:hypothetical protein
VTSESETKDPDPYVQKKLWFNKEKERIPLPGRQKKIIFQHLSVVLEEGQILAKKENVKLKLQIF